MNKAIKLVVLFNLLVSYSYAGVAETCETTVEHISNPPPGSPSLVYHRKCTPIKNIENENVIEDIAKWGDGLLKYMKKDEATAYCRSLNMRLPSLRDYRQLKAKHAVSGSDCKTVEITFWDYKKEKDNGNVYKGTRQYWDYVGGGTPSAPQEYYYRLECKSGDSSNIFIGSIISGYEGHTFWTSEIDSEQGKGIVINPSTGRSEPISTQTRHAVTCIR